jgi:hypothetical protein
MSKRRTGIRNAATPASPTRYCKTVLLLIEGNEAKHWPPGLATDHVPSPW